MRRFLFFLIILICCSGCTAEYHLNIDKSFKEDVSVFATDDDEKEKIDAYHQFLPINVDADEPSIFEKKYDGVNYYKMIKKSDSIRFSYLHDIDSFSNDMINRSCYRYVNSKYTKNNKNFLLSTSDKFLCFDKYDYLDDVKIVITSKYKLKETNADLVEHHQYTWNIKRGNDDQHLYLLLDMTKKDLTFLEKILEGEYFNIFTVSLGLFFLGLVIWFVLMKKGARKNKI